MYWMSQINRDIVMSSSQDSITTVSLMNGSKKSAQLVNKDLLYRLDGLFPFYIRQWWCHRQMFYHFKWCHGCLNALALIIVVAGIVAGSVLENSLLIAAGTVIKGWNDFKTFSFKIDMRRFAYTTYDKALIELRKPRRRGKAQKGGLLPLAALIPALVAAGKAAALGGISGAALTV